MEGDQKIIFYKCDLDSNISNYIIASFHFDYAKLPNGNFTSFIFILTEFLNPLLEYKHDRLNAKSICTPSRSMTFFDKDFIKKAESFTELTSHFIIGELRSILNKIISENKDYFFNKNYPEFVLEEINASTLFSLKLQGRLEKEFKSIKKYKNVDFNIDNFIQQLERTPQFKIETI